MLSDDSKKRRSENIRSKFKIAGQRAASQILHEHDLWAMVARGEDAGLPKILSEPAVTAIIENLIELDRDGHEGVEGWRQVEPSEKWPTTWAPVTIIPSAGTVSKKAISPPRSSPRESSSGMEKTLYLLILEVKTEQPETKGARNLLLAGDEKMKDFTEKQKMSVLKSVPDRWSDGIGPRTRLVAYWDKGDARQKRAISTYVSDIKAPSSSAEKTA